MNPASLTLPELRSLRTDLQNEEDAVSFVRRLAQGRLDVVREEKQKRGAGKSLDAQPEQLAAVFGQQQGGGSVRPPRDTEVPAHHPRLAELTALCDTFHFADFAELSLGELDALVVALEAFEMVQSTDRKSLFGQIDALSAELVARYKNGGANINSLLE
ncbi:MAG: hypothetical protein JHC90_03385 [Ilumatobacteraceae bacterium]|jgi:hypothetical protein|nr:hypothetical protein [Ilumatobacteraceae bacterium]